MKSKHIFSGVLLITIGILWILKMLGVIAFSWCAFFKLWPLILIWVGIKLIPISDKWKIALNIIVLFIGIAFLLILSNSNCCGYEWNKTYHHTNDWICCHDDDDGDATSCTNKNFIKYENYENARLQLTASAGKLTFSPGEELFAIKEKENSYSKILIRNIIEDNVVNIKAELQPLKKTHQKRSYKYDILLNQNPVWDIDLELNATAGQIDLSAFKIKELNVEANASALDLKLGSLYPEVNVTVESNASAVEITIPKEMKCSLNKAESILSSFSVKGLEKQSDNQYVSCGDGETAGVIHITIETNVSSVEIKRY